MSERTFTLRGCERSIDGSSGALASVAALAFSSLATPILASLLILGGLGLGLIAWGERG